MRLDQTDSPCPGLGLCAIEEGEHVLRGRSWWDRSLALAAHVGQARPIAVAA